MPPAIPIATYRVQLTADFKFDDAASIVPYLKSHKVPFEGSSLCEIGCGEGGVLVGSDREMASVLARMATERTHESVPRSSSLEQFSWPAVVERHRELYAKAGAASRRSQPRRSPVRQAS